MNGRRYLRPFIHADVSCDQDVYTDRETGDEPEDDADGFRVETDGGQSLRGGKLTDDGGIGGIEELLQNAGSGDRKGEEQDLSCQAAVDHVDLVLLRFFVSSNCC